MSKKCKMISFAMMSFLVLGITIPNKYIKASEQQVTGTIITVAGTGVQGYTGDRGLATTATLNDPCGVTVDSAGNIYIADTQNHVIRKVDTTGKISTVAGTGVQGCTGDGGLATSATLYFPAGVAVDSRGNIYIADSANNRIRKVDTTGKISTVAGTGVEGYTGDGGLATSATLSCPEGIALGNTGNMYIVERNNSVIRKVDTTGKISTVAGMGEWGYTGDGGLATSAKLSYPEGLAVDNIGNIYIADNENHAIRKVDTTGKISTVAGTGKWGYTGDDGLATSATLKYPKGLAVDNAGNIYIADTENHVIRKVFANNPTNSIISPSTGSFDKNASKQADISTTMTLNGNTLNSIQNDTNTLVNGTDYIISGNLVTIKKSYLTQQNVGAATLTFNFSAGNSQALNISITDTTPKDLAINPISASFDKNTSKQADISITMTLNGNTLSNIKNGTNTLVNGKDYTVSGSIVTIKKSYLAQQNVGTATLTFKVSAGNSQTLNISITDTTPKNLTINPVSASFDKNASKQTDISITMTLNGNTLNSIQNDTNTLVNGTDYIVSGNLVTIKKSYLTQQNVGTAILTFNFSAENSQTLSVSVIDTTVHVISVSLNKTSDTLTVGDTDTLTAAVAPANAANKTVNWSSSDENIAKVTNGVVTAVGVGTAIITVTTEDGNKNERCAVTVNPVPVEKTQYTLSELINDEDTFNKILGKYDLDKLKVTVKTNYIEEIDITQNDNIHVSSFKVKADEDKVSIVKIMVAGKTITMNYDGDGVYKSSAYNLPKGTEVIFNAYDANGNLLDSSVQRLRSMDYVVDKPDKSEYIFQELINDLDTFNKVLDLYTLDEINIVIPTSYILDVQVKYSVLDTAIVVLTKNNATSVQYETKINGQYTAPVTMKNEGNGKFEEAVSGVQLGSEIRIKVYKDGAFVDQIIMRVTN